MKTIKYGIVGTGMIAGFFAEDMAFVENSEVIAVCSRTMKKANAFKEKHNLKYAYDSYEEMLLNEEIDVIYVATPHSRHKDDTIKAMRSKKAVLCEKPITVNSEELEEVLRVQKEEQVLLMEAIWTRFLPSTHKVLEIIESKELGELTYIQADFGFNVGPNYDPGNRLLNKDLAGGARLDVGIYPVFYTDLLFGKIPDRIESLMKPTHTEVDGVTLVQFDYGNHQMAQLGYAVTAHMRQEAYIVFEKGMIRVPHFWMGDQVHVEMIPGDYNGENMIHKTYDFKRESRGYDYEIEAFNESFRNNKTENKLMPLSRSKRIMKLLDLCEEAS